MRKMTILGLLAALAVGISAVSVFAETMASPLQQWNQGVPLEEIQCNDGKILMETNREKPACVTKATSEKMLNHGWDVVLQKTRSVDTHSFSERKTISQSIKPKIISDIHSSGPRINIPFIIYETPDLVNVGDIFSINYTISWINDDGTPLYPSYSENENSSVDYATSPQILLPDQFQILSTGFEFGMTFVDQISPNYQVVYTGDPVLYDDTKVIKGSIQIKMNKKMFYTHDFLDIWFDKVRDSGATFALVSDNNQTRMLTQDSAIAEIGDSWQSEIPDSYTPYSLSLKLGYDEDNHQWMDYYEDMVVPTRADGLALNKYHGESPNSDASGSSSQSEDSKYMDAVHWDDFAQWLRAIEDSEGIVNYRDWLLADGMSEKFVSDFLNAYPEFSVTPSSFWDRLIPSVKATSPNNFYAYGKYIANDYTGGIKGGNNVLICTYDSDET